jgi:hypothetical protein
MFQNNRVINKSRTFILCKTFIIQMYKLVLSTSAFLQTMTDYPRDDPDTNNSLSFNDKTNQNKINPQRRKLPHYQE